MVTTQNGSYKHNLTKHLQEVSLDSGCVLSCLLPVSHYLNFFTLKYPFFITCFSSVKKLVRCFHESVENYKFLLIYCCLLSNHGENIFQIETPFKVVADDGEPLNSLNSVIEYIHQHESTISIEFSTKAGHCWTKQENLFEV